MMGLQYISKQVYSYDDYEKLIDTLNKTQASDYSTDQCQKVIEYTFDRKKYIRLSDLIFWIKIKFIRFHFGQLLDLFENLLLYVQYIISNGIQHNYLDCNRIWLKQKSESEYPSIVHSKLLYDVVFTGYQCPFYENSQTQESVEFKIIELIQNIVKIFKKEEIFLIKNKKKKEEQMNIYIQLSQEDQYQNIQSLLCKIQNLKIHFKYHCQSQMLSFDKSTNKQLSFRRKRISKVKLIIENVIKTLVSKNNQCIQEKIFNNILILIASSLDNYGKFKTPIYDLEKIYQQQQYEQDQIETKLRQQIYQMINSELMRLIKQCEVHFKFNFSKEEINQMEQQIQNAVLQKTIFSYFENCDFDNSQDLVHLKTSMASKIVLQLIHELFNLILQLKILNLIQDLI